MIAPPYSTERSMRFRPSSSFVALFNSRCIT